MKNPLLYRSAWPESGREVRESFLRAPLALSSSVRRDLEQFARHRPLRRPSKPKQHWDFHQPERRLTTPRSGDIARAEKKVV